MFLRLPLFAFFIFCALLSQSNRAWSQSGPVLDRIKNGGKIVIAHRESSVPFSYLDGNKKPVGYALDLCVRIAETVRKRMGAKLEDGIEVPPMLLARADEVMIGSSGLIARAAPLAFTAEAL